MSGLAWKRSFLRYTTTVISSLVLLSVGGHAWAQNFNQLPTTNLYAVQAAVPSYPIVEDGEHACSIIAETLNDVPPGTTQWYEYTNPWYGIHPEWGEGCGYDVRPHGGMGGYPEGHVLFDWFAQN